MHTVSYRYFTGGPKFNGDNDVMRGLIVSEWEANIKPSEIVFSGLLIILLLIVQLKN